MRDTEKTLIIELFNKLHNIELQTPDKDVEAEKIINNLLHKNNNATYYMVQTLLVQEILIKELTDKIKTLENKINQINYRSGFLSGHVKNKIVNTVQKDAQLDKNNRLYNSNIQHDSHALKNNYTNNQNNPTNKISSFIGNALQTAVGVAGGIVAGNMLSDFLHHNKDESSVSHEVKTIDSHDSDNFVNDTASNNFFTDKHINHNVSSDNTIDSNDHHEHHLYDMNDLHDMDDDQLDDRDYFD